MTDSIRQTLQSEFGIETPKILYNLSSSALFQEALKHDRGRVLRSGGYNEAKAFGTSLKDNGPIVFLTDPDCTGRPVDDTYAVAWNDYESDIWWKDSLKKYDPDHYQTLLGRVVSHLNDHGGRLYIQDVVVGHDESYAIPYRFVGQCATHAMFARNMFRTDNSSSATEKPRWTMLNVQTFRCDPKRDGCRSDRVAVIDFRNRICLVAGPADYCGLVKKTIFTVMNFLLPLQGFLSMHCAANVGASGDSAIMFGLSGTGKTTLSADASRMLIGDDETGWTDSGISNLENGCYAKLIDLDKEAEPVIAEALSMPGTIIENVPPLPNKPYDQTHPQEFDLTDSSRTQNTRFSFPLDCNPNIAQGARGGHPDTIVLLTADAFGVLPPVSVLESEEAVYHFVQGFTARVAGTEIGVTDPEATFSSCYGAPFMSHKPKVYAELLKSKLKRHKVRCVLLNTGWTGGPAGKAPRISIRDTRTLLNAAMRGDFHDNGAEHASHPTFKLRYPKNCAGVDSAILDPKGSWRDKAAYDRSAEQLRNMFRDNFRQQGYRSFGISEMM